MTRRHRVPGGKSNNLCKEKTVDEKQLCYVSTLTNSERDLSSILATSVKNNKLANMTGMLLVARSNVLQVLEGPRDAVDLKFARIAADPRHYDLLTLFDEDVPKRSFPNFSMGYHDLAVPVSGLLQDDISTFAIGDGSALRRVEPGQAKELLQLFSTSNQ